MEYVTIMITKPKWKVVYATALAIWAIGGIFAEAVSADPVITAFSSTVTSGTATNKDNAQDLMYLMTQGGAVTFQVTATGAEAYEWRVNKAVQAAATGNSLAWTVPGEKGIWEIHLKVTGGGVEVHQEWAVSTMTGAEAPDFFEYFTDGKFEGTRTDTDPWGRALKTWQVFHRYSRDVYPYDASKKFWWRPDWRGTQYRVMSAPSDIGCGTWKFRYRFSQGTTASNVSLSMWPVLTGTSSSHQKYRYTIASDQHCWFSGDDGKIAYREIPWRGTMNMLGHGTSWHDLTIIRTQDGYWSVWIDGRFLHDTLENFSLVPLPDKIAVNLARTESEDDQDKWTEFDCLEVYKNKYIPPTRSVSYGTYYEDMSSPTAYTTGTGILIKGWGVTLQEIADTLADPTKFTYDTNTKTAVCYTNLCVQPGAQLLLNGETLKLNSPSPGTRVIRVFNGSSVVVENSTIISDGENNYVWHFTSEFYREYLWGGPSTDTAAAYWFKGIFIVRDSTIDNCGFMYLSGPNTVILDNSEFTNIVGVTGDMGGNTPTQMTKANVGDSISVAFRLKNPLYNFTIRKCSFTAKNSETMKFLAGDVFGNTTIYDNEFTNFTLEAREMNYWLAYGTDFPLTCNMNMVNCKFGELSVKNTYRVNSITAKYYLDVKVVDECGNLIHGAAVSVSNEVDDTKFPSENLEQSKVTTTPLNEGLNTGDSGQVDPYYKNVYGKKTTSATTGTDGHTPLPSDVQNTLIIADFVQYQSSRTDFTHAITAEKDGESKTVTGINPGSTWYRPDAETPTSITVRPGAGLGGSDRITIVWADNAIQKQWLQVTVKATTATGLASNDVFYFGNAIGETGNSATDAMVKPTDEIGARNNPHTLGGNPAGIDDVYDFDRDKKVGPTDEIIARNNGTNSTTALNLISAP